LSGLRVIALLEGSCGRLQGDPEATVHAVMKVAQRVEMSVDNLVELDVNPLVVRPLSNGVVGVDASVFVRP
jgi:hypothetical protein